jgi:glucose-6-phosphate isomerase
MVQLNDTAGWKALASHYQQIKDAHLRELFADDRGRGERLTAEGAGLYLDYSKNRITDETVRLLLGLAAERGVAERRDAMFRGDKINITEQRAALHVALRAPKGTWVLVDGRDVVPDVHQVLGGMSGFAASIRSGAWLGSGDSSSPIRSVSVKDTNRMVGKNCVAIFVQEIGAERSHAGVLHVDNGHRAAIAVGASR